MEIIIRCKTDEDICLAFWPVTDRNISLFLLNHQNPLFTCLCREEEAKMAEIFPAIKLSHSYWKNLQQEESTKQKKCENSLNTSAFFPFKVLVLPVQPQKHVHF